MREHAVVFDMYGSALSWHRGISPVEIQDSRALWDTLWEHRCTVGGVAHSHPGYDDVPTPSATDLTTFSAIERGLGRRLLWPIVNGAAINYWGAMSMDFDINLLVLPRWIKLLTELRERSWTT